MMYTHKIINKSIFFKVSGGGTQVSEERSIVVIEVGNFWFLWKVSSVKCCFAAADTGERVFAKVDT